MILMKYLLNLFKAMGVRKSAWQDISSQPWVHWASAQYPVSILNIMESSLRQTHRRTHPHTRYKQAEMHHTFQKGGLQHLKFPNLYLLNYLKADIMLADNIKENKNNLEYQNDKVVSGLSTACNLPNTLLMIVEENINFSERNCSASSILSQFRIN